MSIYYVYANDTKREWFDPDRLGDPVSRPTRNSGIALWLLLRGVGGGHPQWGIYSGDWRDSHIRAVDDTGDEHWWIRNGYRDGVDSQSKRTLPYPYTDITDQLIEEGAFDFEGIAVRFVEPFEGADKPTDPDAGIHWTVEVACALSFQHAADRAQIGRRDLQVGDRFVYATWSDRKHGQLEILTERDIDRWIDGIIGP